MVEKVYLVSLGCPKNRVDSEVIAALLLEGGFDLVAAPEGADIIIINTCSFIKSATEEAIDTTLEMAQFKGSGSCRYLVVTGCFPQRYQQDLEDLLPEVDLFVGTGQYHQIIEHLQGLAHDGKRMAIGSPVVPSYYRFPRLNSSAPYMAYLKIAEGCSSPCSFCIVPRLRGPYRSQPLQSLVEEAEALVEGGVKEISLVAQNTMDYGEDLGNGTSLVALLESLVRISGLQWIRIMYGYPGSISSRLVELLEGEEKICPYLDLPIQHSEDRILKSMKRGYTRRDLEVWLEELRCSVPQIALRTSVIVGYPGESEGEFSSLLEFLRAHPFRHLGAFQFSPEDGTEAAALPGRIPGRIVEERYHELMTQQAEISLRENQGLIDSVLKMVVEGEDGETLRGRASFQAPEIDGRVVVSKGRAAVGEIVQVRITGAFEYELAGEIV